jgi:5-(carboxyamino)imidazole ribonucleotide synthase
MTLANRKVIEPGSTICILGGGQLGKMSLVAARQLGYHVMIWAPEGDNPAMEMATHRIIAPFDDEQAFAQVCSLADVVTTEWENIPVQLLERLEQVGKLVRPSSKVLAIAQSRRAEKNFATRLGFNPTPWTGVEEHRFILRDKTTIEKHLPGILKTNRNGYDGKGQWEVESVDEVNEVFKKAGGPCVLEQKLRLDREVSVIVARNAYGKCCVSNAVINIHKDGILDTTVWYPSSQATNHEQSVQQTAIAFAEELELVGILALEFFVSEGHLYFNEMAPRPHNSFHASIEASYTSQFEQHIRAICNLPLGNMSFHTSFKMKNLVGREYDDWKQHLVVINSSRIHLYGKNESRPGRKMGHVTTLLT